MDTSFSPRPEGATTPISVGLDLSLTHTGIALIHADGTIATQSVRSTGRKDAPLSERTSRLIGLVGEILTTFPWMVREVVLEGPSFGSNDPGAHERAGLWWMLVGELASWGQAPIVVAPSTAKKYITGRGNATKDEVVAAAVKRYPNADITNNNTADAAVLAAIGARLVGHPVDGDLNQKQAEAFATVVKAVMR